MLSPDPSASALSAFDPRGSPPIVPTKKYREVLRPTSRVCVRLIKSGTRMSWEKSTWEKFFPFQGGTLFLRQLPCRIVFTKIGEYNGKSYVWSFGLTGWLYR